MSRLAAALMHVQIYVVNMECKRGSHVLTLHPSILGDFVPALHGKQVSLSAPLVLSCWPGLCRIGITEFVLEETASAFASLSLGL